MKFLEFLKKKWLVVLIAVLVLTGGIITAVLLLGNQNEDVIGDEDEITTPEASRGPKERIRLNLEALMSDKTGVKTESGFKLSFPKGIKLDVNLIKEALNVTPSFDFDLKKENDGVVIKPKSALQANSVYTFKLNLPEQNIKESWAFQTRREFKIVSTLPANESTQVPTNTGIEITFSHKDISEFENHFSIEPKVEGRFEMHDNVAVFVPEALEPDTIYTVTVDKGITQSESGESLQEKLSFSFQTMGDSPGSQEESTYLSFYEWLFNFSSGAQPVLEVSASEDMLNEAMAVSIYRYDDTDSFITDYSAINKRPSWALLDKNSLIPELASKDPYKSYNLSLESTSAYYYSYLMLPENLPEGYYLIVLKSGDREDYAFVQINDIQLYMNMGEDKSLIWANDLVTGESVGKAVFEGNGIQAVTTDEEGLALINEDLYKGKKDRTLCFTLTREGHPALVATLYNSGYGWGYRPEGVDFKSNWNTLYLDRSTYLPTDSVKAWGILRPRNGDAPLKTVTVNLVSSVYNYRTYEYNTQVLMTKEVPVTSRGTYTVDFTLESLPTGNYQVEAKNGETTVASNYLYVNKYIKSQYIVSLNSEYLSYFSGETLKALVGCEFFEGTPVPGYEMSYYLRNYESYESIHEGNLTLDDQGRSTMTLTLPEQEKPCSWRPQSHRLSVNNTDPEETELSERVYFQVFPRDVMVQTEMSLDKGNADIEFKTHAIDLTPIRYTGEIYGSYGEEPLYQGDPVGKNLTVTLYERYWDKKETGEHYDFISKQNVKDYEYFEVNQELNQYTVETQNGTGRLTFTIPDYSLKKSYYIVYETVDNKNRPIKEETYLYDNEGYWYGYGYGEDYYYLEIAKEETSYQLGEAVDFSLKKNNNEPVEGGKVLYMVLQDGIKRVWTSSEAAQSFDFAQEYVPNVYLTAVYFDGKNIYNAYERLITFDYDAKELDISVKTDKDSYKPGETVNCTLRVSDNDGNPCLADVNLSVVDEAYFALYEQSVDTIGDLYRSIYDAGVYSTYISHRKVYKPSGGAEGGEGEDEGGGSAVRKNFVDNAWFETVETDSNGEARISFKVPDNLTSWRLTYQAFTEDIKAGSGHTNLTTRLPFFVKAIVNDTFMEGDTPTLLLRGYGEAVKPQDKIDFEVTLQPAEGKSVSLEGKGSVSDFTEITLPELKEGLYTLTIRGTKGELSDAIEKKIQVCKSLLSAKQVDYYSLSQDLKLKEVQSYATVSFYNTNLSDYYLSLSRLYWSWGNRLDQVLARNVAMDLLKKHFDDGYYYFGDKADVTPYQKDDGGFALLPYGSSDVELSAKVAALCGQEVNTSRLLDYFRAVVENPDTTPLQVSAAYWGLASLREPVLLDVQGFMEEGDMTLDEELYLGIALAELGDMGGAEKIYSQITKAYSKELEPYRYIDDNGDKDDILRWTSLTAILAAKVNDPADENRPYFKYIEQLNPDETLMNLERLILVKQGIPSVSRDSSFTLQTEGLKETVTLDDAKPYTVLLSPKQLKALEFSKIMGDITLSVTYEGLQDKNQTQNVMATVSRKYNGQKGTQLTLDRTGTVTVSLTVEFDEKAPEGYYDITDVLPAGLRYISAWQADSDDWYYGEPDGQRVKLGCYYDGSQKTQTISYKARVFAAGSYTADSAMVKHSESEACGFSERATVTIE